MSPKSRYRIRFSLPRSWLPIVILLAGITFSMYLFLQIEDEVFFGGDSGLKWLMTRQFSEGDVSPYIATHQPAWVLQLWDDGFAPFTPPFVYATPQGYLTAFPVWFSLLSTPFFLLFGTCGIYILPMVALWGLWWRIGMSPNFVIRELMAITTSRLEHFNLNSLCCEGTKTFFGVCSRMVPNDLLFAVQFLNTRFSSCLRVFVAKCMNNSR